MERVLVTGGGGFIGSHIVRALLGEGYAVRVLDNFETGRRENLAEVKDDIDLLDGGEGLLSPEACERAVEGVSFVLHQGAIPSVPRSIADPVQTNRVNVGGTLKLLEACRKAGVRRLVFASSSSVYGDTPGEVRWEEDSPRPLSPYAVSKWAGEAYAVLYYRLHGLETVSLRYFNVFGPRQDPNSPYSAVVPLFVRSLLAGEPPTIFGDGEQSRDFTYVENVVRGNLLAMKAEGVAGEVFNVAAGESHTVNRLFACLRDIIGAEGIRPEYKPARPGDVVRSQAGVTKARERLGFEVGVSFEEGLRRTVDSYRDSAGGGA